MDCYGFAFSFGRKIAIPSGIAEVVWFNEVRLLIGTATGSDVERSPKGGIICVRQTTPYLLVGSQAILTQFLSLDRSPPPCVCRVTKKLMEQCFIAKILKYSFEYRHWNASFFVVLREDDSAVMSSVGRNVSFCLKSISTCVLKMRCFRSKCWDYTCASKRFLWGKLWNHLEKLHEQIWISNYSS